MYKSMEPFLLHLLLLHVHCASLWSGRYIYIIDLCAIKFNDQSLSKFNSFIFFKSIFDSEA